MGFDDCYQLGNVIKTHGLQGELIFRLDVDDPSHYKKLESVFINLDGKLIPFFIHSMQLQGEKAIVGLEDVDSLGQAQEFVGKDLYLPVEMLPKLSKGQYYYHDLIGFSVFQGDQLVGIVKEVFQLPGNHLMGVDHEGREVLIPLEDEIITEVDMDKKTIHTHLPEGLLDIYLNQ